jgi:adenylate kinase family enzyme
MLLGSSDRLPAWPHRVLVAGTSGSGKTSLARRVASELGTAHVELDALHHGPNWTRRTDFTFEVERLSAGSSWVMEWQYDEVRPLLAERADLMVWLDLPRRVVMTRVTFRTLRRAWRKEVLWSGNVEPGIATFFTDRKHIVRWAWGSHGETAKRVEAIATRLPSLPVVRLRDRRSVERWVAGPFRAAIRDGGPGRSIRA